MHHAQRRSRGFTLFELLVVIVLIGVAAGIVGVAVNRGMQANAERQALSHIVDALRAARVQAIVSGQPARTLFDLRQRSVQAPGTRAFHWPRSLDVELHTAEQLGAAFEFYPDGGASGGHILVSRDQSRWRIDVSWLTGVVELHTLQ
ncbi:type II secretion system protein [Pseudomonas sp. v388]|uniref:type II secretion system protein n=1 Tax=Pseudomonas sp. v388 TaxID=2479849 RepID=UPI000F79BAF1|nr:type II secretion system protein [Pseudomonas sp. v388]RRV10687.1 type II secretion system protein [Pseudomonas sp. v388]